ncbi:hypothetical protein HO133_003550 [Letharia lupina]|uniref:Methyltransferase type 11 domain-containing protein n=1 Tax=Letharia lupina TaxID=560253 RepID=A0A8H6F936_9LECA|nr:uncharacterized protein HO133_003550 [Letharia lupina]KAF6219725.1 hypothetical protein HO133_003550 [Letharia lupina]
MSVTDVEGWGAAAAAYAQVERVTTPPSQSLLNRVSAILPLNAPNTTAFDNGCGTGVLTTILKQQNPNVPLLAADYSDGMVDILKRRVQAQKLEEVTARVVDGRNLQGIKDGSFTHTFSTFMVCLAPEPDKIVAEMHRVTKQGGVLGLAVWGDPRFGPFSSPWEKACRRLISDYEPPMIMPAEWTLAENVKAGLEKAGFGDVDVWVENVAWRWDSVEALSGYYFEGGNPGNVKVLDSFKALGGKVDEARPIFERIIKEECGKEDGSVELRVPATLATARK